MTQWEGQHKNYQSNGAMLQTCVSKHMASRGIWWHAPITFCILDSQNNTGAYTIDIL